MLCGDRVQALIIVGNLRFASVVEPNDMKALRPLVLGAALLLGACATVSTHVVQLDPALQLAPTTRVEVLLQKPERAHIEIALLESRGTSEAEMLNDAREKAGTLGADAIVKLETERIYHEPLPVYDPWFDPFYYGYYPYRPFPLRAHPWSAYRFVGAGFSYVLKALAIKYREGG